MKDLGVLSSEQWTVTKGLYSLQCEKHRGDEKAGVSGDSEILHHSFDCTCEKTQPKVAHVKTEFINKYS